MSRIGIFGLLLAGLACAADDGPVWLRDLTSVALPQYGPKVDTVVLFNEEHTTISDTGKLSTTTRTAIKILRRTTADIEFYETYVQPGDKVRDFRAWMIAPAGKLKKYGNDEIVDIACAPNDVYNECRRRMVSGKRDSEAGAVFGYEATVERQSFSNQLRFHFQDFSPVRLARFIVTAPAGWEVKTASFNDAPKESAPGAGTYTWQMENLPAMEYEPASPGFATLTPWVGVNLLGGGKQPGLTWPEVAKQLAELNNGQAEPDEAITAKAKGLIAGAKTDLEKIAALGRFAQSVNYVSVQVNLAKGGGYRPHAASQVYRKLYGDCKDKANLMRALLKAAGFTAYPVAIYAGDRTHVSAQWPSLNAFNHAISAIRVGPETTAPAVLDHPKLGRLLFFDPTDPYVPAGYLPDHEQGSLALVADGDMGDLVTIPVSRASASGRDRQVDAVLKADGSIEGAFVERRTREALPDGVSAYRARTKADYVKSIERWLGRSIQGAAASGIEVDDREGEFVLKGKFASVAYAQRPQARMLIFRAALLRHSDLRLTEKTRKYPIVIDADALEETVRIVLPAEFKVDEAPQPVRIESEFGRFEASWTVVGSSVVFQRKFEMQAQTVPPGRYAELRRFLDEVSGSAEQPIVLLK